MRKSYLTFIRNVRDNSTRNMCVCDSSEESRQNLRAFLHNHPETAYVMFPDDWQFVVVPLLVSDDVIAVEDPIRIPFAALIPAKEAK